jgi:hypothetical protein
MRIAILQPLFKYINSTAYIANMIFLRRLISGSFEVDYLMTDRTFLPEARNQLVKKFVENKDRFDIALWLDSDHQFKAEDFIRLLNVFKAHQDIKMLSGRYLLRSDDEQNYLCAMIKKNGMYQTLTMESQGITEVDAVGLGFCLIDPDVLVHGWNKYKNLLFKFQCVNDDTLQYKGEDVWFCEKVKKMGYKIFVDHNVNIGHYGFNRFPRLIDIKE